MPCNAWHGMGVEIGFGTNNVSDVMVLQSRSSSALDEMA